jgi:hypothetical protein
VLTDPIFLFSSFLNVGAGFALTKANLFPIEAARGGAQFLLVRRPGRHGGWFSRLPYIYYVVCLK